MHSHDLNESILFIMHNVVQYVSGLFHAYVYSLCLRLSLYILKYHYRPTPDHHLMEYGITKEEKDLRILLKIHHVSVELDSKLSPLNYLLFI